MAGGSPGLMVSVVVQDDVPETGSFVPFLSMEISVIVPQGVDVRPVMVLVVGEQVVISCVMVSPGEISEPL